VIDALACDGALAVDDLHILQDLYLMLGVWRDEMRNFESFWSVRFSAAIISLSPFLFQPVRPNIECTDPRKDCR